MFQPFLFVLAGQKPICEDAPAASSALSIGRRPDRPMVRSRRVPASAYWLLLGSAPPQLERPSHRARAWPCNEPAVDSTWSIWVSGRRRSLKLPASCARVAASVFICHAGLLSLYLPRQNVGKSSSPGGQEDLLIITGSSPVVLFVQSSSSSSSRSCWRSAGTDQTRLVEPPDYLARRPHPPGGATRHRRSGGSRHGITEGNRLDPAETSAACGSTTHLHSGDSNARSRPAPTLRPRSPASGWLGSQTGAEQAHLRLLVSWVAAAGARPPG